MCVAEDLREILMESLDIDIDDELNFNNLVFSEDEESDEDALTYGIDPSQIHGLPVPILTFLDRDPSYEEMSDDEMSDDEHSMESDYFLEDKEEETNELVRYQFEAFLERIGSSTALEVLDRLSDNYDYPDLIRQHINVFDQFFTNHPEEIMSSFDDMYHYCVLDEFPELFIALPTDIVAYFLGLYPQLQNHIIMNRPRSI